MSRLPKRIDLIQPINVRSGNQTYTPPHSARSSRKPSNSSADADHSEDLSEYFSVTSLTQSQRSPDATNDDDTFNSVRSRASLEDALWSDDEDKNDRTDLSTSRSADIEPSIRERMRHLAASQEYRLLLAKGYDMQQKGNAVDALRVYTTVLEASRTLNDPDLQSQALTRLGLLYQRTYADAEGAAQRIQRIFRGHMGRNEARYELLISRSGLS